MGRGRMIKEKVFPHTPLLKERVTELLRYPYLSFWESLMQWHISPKPPYDRDKALQGRDLVLQTVTERDRREWT